MTVICDQHFQNIPSVPGDSSGVCRVQSALLSLLRSHGEHPVQRHHEKGRVQQTTPSFSKPPQIWMW